MQFKRTLAGVLILAFGLAFEASAHHGSNVSYDSTKTFTTKAVMREFAFINPHVTYTFDVADGNGTVTQWTGEGPDPAVFVQSGWGRKRLQSALAPGTEVTITIIPSKLGKPVCIVSKVVLADGTTIGSDGSVTTKK